MPVTSLLSDAATASEDVGLALDLIANCVFHAPDGVDVLGLGSGAELLLTLGTQRNVRVAADVSSFHLGVRDVHGLHDVANVPDIGTGKLGRVCSCAKDWLGHDLNQGNSGTVKVHQRVFRSLNTTGCATYVGELPGVLFHVGALDEHLEHLAVRDLNIELALKGNWLVILRGLEVLGQIRIEIVLSREAAIWGNLTAEG